MFSIDQNCHSLWDALPKLEALAAHGHHVQHFIEDVDVAFTALGASVDDAVLHLARERFHRSGGQDWGAALFYSKFLGKLPVEIRHWEPCTGLKSKTLARKLERSLDDLYDEFSPGDTWQLIGSSYVGDRDHHRVIGDLSVRETCDFIVELFRRAKADMRERFPERASRERLAEWFAAEEARLTRLLDAHASATLVELYRAWMVEHLAAGAAERVRLGLSSSLLACQADRTRVALLEVFVRDYERASALYNEALAETDSDLRPLRVADGELPFFAIQEHQGHLVRTAGYLSGLQVRFGKQTFALTTERGLPMGEMVASGIRSLAGKAVVLVTQVRIGPNGRPLALPYRGSLYMPTAHRLVEKLAAQGLLPAEVQPVVRVRFRLLDRLKELATTIRLPDHLAECFGRAEIPASELGKNWEDLRGEAAERLARFADPAGGDSFAARLLPDLSDRIAALEERRKQLAQADTTPEQMSNIWRESKTLQTQLLDQTLRQIARDWQVRELDYWDSRGALLPWAIALGGRDFYDDLLRRAEFYHEGPTPGHREDG